MTAKVPAGRAVVEVLEAEGITTVFGIPGGHILPVHDAVRESRHIEHLNVVTAVAEGFVGALPMIILGGRGSTATTYRGASANGLRTNPFDSIRNAAR